MKFVQCVFREFLPHYLPIVHLEPVPDRSKAAPLTPALINAKVQPLALYTRKGLILRTSGMSDWTHDRRWDKMLPTVRYENAAMESLLATVWGR